jgi:predicted nicotinamide N-methyase
MPTASDDGLRQRAIPGGWTEQQVSCMGRTLNLLLPADAEALLDELDSLPAPDSGPDVYWAKLWPTALTMGQILSLANWPPGTRVLELGCGIGFVGLAALAAGWQVTFSDYVAIAVEVAMVNALRNGFEAAEGQVFAWQQPPPSAQFAAIIGSDILYEKNNHAALLDLLEKMLRPDGTVWLGDPGRYHVAAFVELAWQRGFDVELRDESGLKLTALTSGQFQLLQLRRCLP